jgi:2-polyprenyl-3-methyl-5-hydroxy-6-metoxy-1,4-benzoquinol methylase
MGYGAPFGFRNEPRARNVLFHKLKLFDVIYPRDYFAYQPNNTTRAFEYPWVFYSLPLKEGARILEVGGGLSGLQFVLSSLGYNVTNVDPGQEEMRKAWCYNEQSFAALNRRFNTDVALRHTTIDKADLADATFDCAYSVSVLEHLPTEAIADVVKHVWRCLKPGGMFVLTVDLFLNLKPFTDRMRNEYGKNLDLKWVSELAPFKIALGDTSEMFGFPGFDPRKLLSQLETLLVGEYPGIIQCFALRKLDTSLDAANEPRPA